MSKIICKVSAPHGEEFRITATDDPSVCKFTLLRCCWDPFKGRLVPKEIDYSDDYAKLVMKIAEYIRVMTS